MTPEEKIEHNRRIDDKIDKRMDLFETTYMKKLDQILKTLDNVQKTADQNYAGLDKQLSDLTKRFDGNEKDGEKSLPARVKSLEDWRLKVLAWATALGIVAGLAKDWILSMIGK